MLPSLSLYTWLTNYAPYRSVALIDTVVRFELAHSRRSAGQMHACNSRDAQRFKRCRRDDVISESDYLQLAQDCDEFRRTRGYLQYTVTGEEKAFPIAFSVLMHEHAEQAERLIRAIYRPHNVYCIHVDTKATSGVRKVMTSIARCLDNVFMAKDPVNVHWAEFTVLEAEFRCIEQLWKQPVKWKYFINLTGREFPIKTNWELVQVLKTYGGANDIDGTPHNRPGHWTKYVWRKEFWMSNKLKPHPPGNWVIAKGSTHIAASRDFIGYILFNKTARDLREWMRDVRAPDEHFFQTLNHNPHMGVPGSYKGDPDLKWFYTRLKFWQDDKGIEKCGGEWVRLICNLGSADLQRIPPAKHMFVNKFRQELDPVAFDCMEQWYQNRTRKTNHSDFDIEFYKELKFVKNHV